MIDANVYSFTYGNGYMEFMSKYFYSATIIV